MMVIGVTITTRLNNMVDDISPVGKTGVISLHAPKDSVIKGLDANEGLLFVALSSPGGEIVMIVEIESGRLVGQLVVEDEP